MKKNGFVFLSLFLLFFSLSPFTFAQTNALADKKISCLKNRPGTIDSIALTWHDPPSPSSLTKHLTGKFTGGSTIYALACKGSGNGRICSTGNRGYDDYLFQDGTDLTQQIKVQFANGAKQKVGTGNVVNYDATVYGTNVDGAGAYSFFGVEILDPARNVVAGDVGAQQQAILNFEITGNQSDCARISWTHYDPYGVVFDSQSLEPLPHVITSILDSNHVKVTNNEAFRNDHTTREDGLFNYNVQPGTYYVAITLPPNYEFKKDPTYPLHKNAQQIYEYIDTNGSACTIYEPDEAIHEIIDTTAERLKGAPNPECRNIPLTPLGKPYIADVTSITYELDQSYLDYYSFEGKVSHPFTRIEVSQNNGVKVKGQDSKKQIANNAGFYSFKIPVPNFAQDAPIDITFIKNDLTGKIISKTSPFDTLNKFLSSLLPRLFHYEIYAKSTPSKITIDPILKNIEGYAYDAQHAIVPNAKVGIRIKVSGGLYHQTTADEQGYFYISSGNLPLMAYTIEVTSPISGKTTSYKTYEFTKANSKYLSANKINLLIGSKGEQLITQKKTSPSSPGESSNGAASEEGQSVTSNTTSEGAQQPSVTPIPNKSFNSAILSVLVFIFLIIIAGGITTWILINKKNQQTPPL